MRVILCFKHRYIKSQIPSTKIQMVRQAHHREPVERLVEPFDIWDLLFGISVTAPVVI